MCAILGGSKSGWNYEAGLAAVVHRGPDMQRTSGEDKFTLAFARLAIIDLSEAAMQPMTSSDGKVTIVYNGEIYGYESLRGKLSQKYPLRSKSDSEVILYAYLEYGDRFVDYIDGIFAIAVYDRRNETVRLFRDRAGVKPLYYYFDGFNFAFASELKVISILLKGRHLDVDYTAIYDYLTYAYIPAPKTMYRNVRQLCPAHQIVYYVGEHKLSRQRRYWNLAVNAQVGRRRKDSDLAAELRELVLQAVREQMEADVPVGTFLSGGVDSSIVTYAGLMVNPELETFSIGFTEKQYDESEYYKEFARKFDCRSNEQIFSRAIFHKLYREMREWYDEPFADTSAFPTYLVSRFAREKVTVVLTGDGGDELFGGYGWYDVSYRKGIFGDSAHISRFYEKLVSAHPWLYHDRLNQLLSETLRKYAWEHCYGVRSMKQQAAKKWGIPKDYDDYWFLREYDNCELPMKTRLQYLDFFTYLPEILTKVDRASMQVSLEARVPLLSRKIIEFAFSLSQEERCPNGEMKHMLRKAFPEIPAKILYKKKQGFCMPAHYVGKDALPYQKILCEVWRM